MVLVAVTKYADPEQVRALAQLGHRDFGENRVQHLIQQAGMLEEFFTRRKIAQRAPDRATGLRAAPLRSAYADKSRARHNDLRQATIELPPVRSDPISNALAQRTMKTSGTDQAKSVTVLHSSKPPAVVADHGGVRRPLLFRP